MTKQMIEAQPDYQRGLARALNQGLRIISSGSSNRNPCWLVTSSTGEGAYCVEQRNHTLTCNCPAGVQDVTCKHKCLVAHALITAQTKTPLLMPQGKLMAIVNHPTPSEKPRWMR